MPDCQGKKIIKAYEKCQLDMVWILHISENNILQIIDDIKIAVALRAPLCENGSFSPLPALHSSPSPHIKEKVQVCTHDRVTCKNEWHLPQLSCIH